MVRDSPRKRARRSSLGAVVSMEKNSEVTDEKKTTSPTDNGLARDVWIVGQELHESVWEGPFVWNFEHLLPRVRSHLRAHPSAKAYIFGTSEPQQFVFPAVDKGGADEIRIVPIPAIVTVFCDAPVPSMLGITSVQSSVERVVPMQNLKMSWCPWRASERLSTGQKRTAAAVVASSPSSSSSGIDSRIFVLHCTMRNGGRGRYIDERRRKEFEYAMPYLLRSKDVPDEPEPVTHVTAVYTARQSAPISATKSNKSKKQQQQQKARRIEFGFDKEVDRTQLFIPDFLEENGLDEDEYDDVKDCLKAAFAAARAAEAERVEALRRKLEDDTTPDERAAVDAAVIVKVYPGNAEIDARVKTPFVNRYYGTAAEVL